MDTNTGTVTPQKKSFTRFFPHIARILMGLAFFAAGAMGLVMMIKKMPDQSPENLKVINAALTTAGYMHVAMVTMLIVGLLLLSNRFVPLALTLIAPILVGIMTYHIATSPGMIVPGAILSLLELYLAWSYRKAFCPMLAAKVTPSEKCSA
jgi:uncharacterized membrane protein YphA (DoxX/SURF4 family)